MDNLTIATTAANVAAIAGLALAIYTALWPLSKINRSMTKLQEQATSSGITAESALILTRISTLPWDTYRLQVQQEASYYHKDNHYVELKADGKYVLTSIGRELLDPRLKERIVSIIKTTEGQRSEKDVVLMLGVHDLVKEAFSKEVPPNVMIGVLVTYLEECE